jgi:hypothetical protein
MRILFVVSASLWAWLVGRCLALGVQTTVFQLAYFEADSWYNLTPIRFKMPNTWVTYLPILFALLSIPILLVDDDLIHCGAVLILVSEHCYIPMFIARIHSSMRLWNCTNIAANALLLGFGQQLFCLPKLFIHIWFFLMEFQLGPIVRETIEYQTRQPRTV